MCRNHKMCLFFSLSFFSALGGIQVHHRDFHPGACSPGSERKPRDDLGLQTLHSGVFLPDFTGV